jgi:hypothetical protein
LFEESAAPPRSIHREKGVELTGIEPPTTLAPIVVDRRQDDAGQATKADARRREVSALEDVVELALANAIEAEVEERRRGWEGRVALLAGELHARRRAREDVPTLASARRRV